MANRQTTEQLRAKAALDAVKEIMQKHRGDKELKSIVNGMPALIQSAGLGPALAFYMAKNKKQFTGVLAQWLLGDRISPDKSKTEVNLMEKITSCSSSEYRLLTTEAMAYLNWLKRFTSANIEDK